MATTMKDVARQAGVDVSTVSLAINNDPRIRRETRERILSIASDLGYRKNHLARGLRSGKSFTIGAVVGYTSSAFWSEVLAGAQSVLAEHDYHLLLDYAPSELRQEETQIEALKQKRVDGFLIAPSDDDPESPDNKSAVEHYRALEEEKIPFVFVDRFVPGLDADYVAADNFSAARTATRHLLRLGHKRVAYVYAPHRMNTAQRERLQGYQSVMKEARLEPIPWEALRPRNERSLEGLEAGRELLADKAGKGVTAILAATDSTAMGVLRALHDAEKKVPEEIALMGFGGASTAEYMHPPLSTVTLPMRALGEHAARILLDRIEGADGPPRHVLLPTQLTIRASCGAAR
ncbi:MAG: LacI family DNA-binding transcriptional regulator [Akkermansiaceae bacterium]|nr:LacI family DNA-binding transcriptional regulator [Armatimonadota bacterium]